MSMKSLPVEGTQRKFKVARDQAGVPHIGAATWLDGIFGLGYMHALDRGTQLLFSRSVACGRAAEKISDAPEMVETDRFFRRVGLYRDLSDEVHLLENSIRSQLAAYCAGVNEGLAAAGRSLPMLATRFQSEPWDEMAVVLVGKLLSFGGLAISQMQSERLLVELIHAGVSQDGLRELFAPRLDGVDFELIRRVRLSSQLSDDALELITDLPRLAGSNAFAVSPQRSATGHALLASDPHLEVNRLPAIWYEAVICWDDNEYVMGASLPGCPLFAVGRTKRLSWGVTYMKGDTVDYFIEDCRQSGQQKWQYRRGDQWFDFATRSEEIIRKGGDDEAMLVQENAQGILECDPEENGLYLSLAWSGNQVGNGGALASWLDIIGSRATAEAMEHARECRQPTLCWMFADREGHIGMQSCGRFPLRGGGYNGLTPIPAWNEENHWQGWVDSAQLPRVYDPVEGYIATANEEMHVAGIPMLVTQPLPDYRQRRICERLSELEKVRCEDLQSIQYDFVSLQARDLLEALMPDIPAGALKEAFANWDYGYSPESREAALFRRFYRNLLVEIFGHDEGIGWRRAVYVVTRVGYSTMILICADRMLKRDKSYWWRTRSKRSLVRRAVEKVDAKSSEIWADVNGFHFADRFFGNHQVGRLLGYKSRRYPMPGNHATPFQGHVLQTSRRETTFAPSYHFVTDMGTDEAWTNLPGGPSESRFSRLYKIDLARWVAGEYKRLVPQR
ncbi:MAG: penicillin acylase family protein [Pirellulaceae bacterium]|nr:penicillin acylase family protein [Pirellulaceae bacterium]